MLNILNFDTGKLLKLKIIIFTLSFFLFLFLPNILLAADEPDLNQYMPDLEVAIGGTKLILKPAGACGASGDGQCIGWIGDYVSALYQYGVGLAAVLAAVMIMVGGFIWLMSAGSPDKVGKAKDFIFSALSGLFLALFSFMILATINPELVSFSPLSTGGLPEFEARSYGEGSGDLPAHYSSSSRGTLVGFNPTALAVAQPYLNRKDAIWTSGIRYDHSRHDPNEPGYAGNVIDFHYDPPGDPNNTLTQDIIDNAERTEEPLPGVDWFDIVYHQPDGSVWVHEYGGSTGFHWHVEFPAPGWRWQQAR